MAIAISNHVKLPFDWELLEMMENDIEQSFVGLEKYYTTYEETHETTAETKLTKSKTQWFLYYLLYVDKEEYKDFVTWLADMIRSGIFVEEKMDQEQ